jgi:hypothetical protein
MTFRQWLRPTNRRIRWLVGCLLVGLFCIQCTRVVEVNHSNVVIARSQNVDGADATENVLHLAKTDPVALLEQCIDHTRRYRDYTCTLIKQERINGALGKEQEIQVKFLASPFSVAMHWTRNAPIGDRVLYVEGKHDNKMIVRPKSGFFRLLTGGAVLRKPNGPDAMKNTLRPVNLFGFGRGMKELLAVYEQARDAGDLKTVFGGAANVAGREALVLERYLPAKDDYPACKTLVYIDPEYLVATCIEGYDWEGRLSSRYVYKDVHFNVGLTEDDFLPAANGIALPKK